MAIKIVWPEFPEQYVSFACVCKVLADNEGEILALGKVVDDGTKMREAAPGSWAYTADLTAIYQMSPGGVWTKIQGGVGGGSGMAAAICGQAICGEVICGGGV